MNKNRILMVGLLGLMMLWVSGCDMGSCPEIQRNYERESTRLSSFSDLTSQGAPHLAMAMRLDLLNDLSADLVGRAIGETLAVRGSRDVVGGQSVGYGVSATGAKLRLEASSACATCVRIRGALNGQVEATIPVLGRRSSPLRGSIDWTVPLDVGREEDGTVAVYIDTAQALRMGVPTVQGRLDGLPQEWAGVVASAMMKELAELVAQNLSPLRLFGYQMPDIGLRGLKMTPSLFAFDSPSNALILGVSTNLAIAQSARSQDEVINALALSEGQNVALGVQPGTVLEAVRLAMQQNRIAQRYSLSGDARRDGTAHVVVDDFQVGSHGEQSDALGLGLDFRIFNFGAGWGCFSMDGLALSRLRIAEERMELDIEGVEFGGSGLADAANWASAQFIQHAQGVVAHTLNEDIVFSPEVGMNLQGQRVSTEAGMLVMRGQGTAVK